MLCYVLCLSCLGCVCLVLFCQGFVVSSVCLSNVGYGTQNLLSLFGMAKVNSNKAQFLEIMITVQNDKYLFDSLFEKNMKFDNKGNYCNGNSIHRILLESTFLL